MAMLAIESTTVATFAWSSWRSADHTSRKNPSCRVSGSTPNSLGNCAAATVSPTPTLSPVSVASLMFSITAPRRSMRAARSSTPTMSVSVTRCDCASGEPATTPAASSVEAVSVAIVDVVVTLAVRDPPRKAYTTSSSMHVYRPIWTGMFATVA
jgi:hypothetical protein